MHTGDTTLQTRDGAMRAYEARPDGEARGGVVVVQEAFGVNAHIEDVTRRLATAGYHAIAPDLFHRAGGGTAEYGDMQAVFGLMRSIPGDEAVLDDVGAAVDALRAAGHADARIGTVGFCFGGRATFLTALHHRIGAAVGFYGGGIVTGRFPQFPPLVERVGELRTPWLGLFGDEDASIPVDDVERLRDVLSGAPVAAEVVRYAGARHGFHCDQRPADFHPVAAADAWSRTLDWFDQHIG